MSRSRLLAYRFVRLGCRLHFVTLGEPLSPKAAT